MIELHTVCDALSKIRREYAEMPEMKLTLPQLARLLNVPAEVCDIAVAALVESGFLEEADNGRYGLPAATTRGDLTKSRRLARVM